MTAKITKPKCLLLDANIIMRAYGLEVWLPLIEQVDVVISSSAVADEALFIRGKPAGFLKG